MYVNEEEDLEVQPPMKVLSLMDLYNLRNYALYELLKNKPWEKVPQIISAQKENDCNAFYQHRPVQASYIEMDSSLLQTFDLSGPTYFQSMENV